MGMFEIICFSFLLPQVHYYVQSHIQLNEYRDRVLLVSTSVESYNCCSQSHLSYYVNFLNMYVTI